METIQITSSELSQMQELGRGACSIVYKYGTDFVIKALNEKGIELHNENEFSSIIGIENSTCVFPKNRVEIDGSFRGYTMDYVQGVPLHEVIKKIDIPTLISAIKNVESDLKQLSSEKVLFQDLNQGGIMWDEAENRIKIIDTDFFEKNETITEEQCYSANITSFNSMIEMELGILNGQGVKLSEYLQNNPEFSKLYTKYMIYSLNGKNMSVTELVDKAVEIFKNDFGTKVNSIEEMQQLIGERTEIKKSEITEEIPMFEPPKNEQFNGSKSRIKQKIIDFFANKPLLRKIPFIDRFVLREQKLLPEETDVKQDTNRQTKHSKFIDEISNNGEYRKLSLGQRVKGVAVKAIDLKAMTGIDKLEPHSMANQEKIEQMKKKMDGKSIDDDL